MEHGPLGSAFQISSASRMGDRQQRKMLQLVTDGMKLSPITPTFLTGRDAIIAAAQASSFAPEAAADVADMWDGFPPEVWVLAPASSQPALRQ